MSTVINGTYENGKIVLDKVPNAKNKSKVVVTFLEGSQPLHLKKRRLGSLKGKIGIPENFNEPLDDLKNFMY